MKYRNKDEQINALEMEIERLEKELQQTKDELASCAKGFEETMEQIVHQYPEAKHLCGFD